MARFSLSCGFWKCGALLRQSLSSMATITTFASLVEEHLGELSFPVEGADLVADVAVGLLEEGCDASLGERLPDLEETVGAPPGGSVLAEVIAVKG